MSDTSNKPNRNLKYWCEMLMSGIISIILWQSFAETWVLLMPFWFSAAAVAFISISFGHTYWVGCRAKDNDE